MSDDPAKKLRAIGNQLISKSQDLNELAKIIPDQSRKMAAYGDYYNYVADEYDRLSSKGIDLSASPGFNYLDEVENTFVWKVPSAYDVTTTTVTASGGTTSITEPFLPYIDSNPEFELLKKPPESYKILISTDETIDKLNQLKEGLGNSWRNAWNAMGIKDLNTIKTVAANARTVFDELSWLAPIEDLKKLDWCSLDDKDRPTRATRFAWILYGGELPESLNKDPSNDPSCKPFKNNYDKLQKYVHLGSLQQSHLIELEIIMKALQGSLEHYLNFGFDRLK